jgi:hypothetical protein
MVKSDHPLKGLFVFEKKNSLKDGRAIKKIELLIVWEF